MPGDLNLKKSWNPALMKNQQKVWQQEQKSLEEIKRIRQLEAEFKQEQENTKLLSLKNKNNQKVTKDDKLKMSKMSWMYDNPNKANEAAKPAAKLDDAAKKQPAKTVSKVQALDPMASIASGIRSARQASAPAKPGYKVTKPSAYPPKAPKHGNYKKELDSADPMGPSNKKSYLSKYNY